MFTEEEKHDIRAMYREAKRPRTQIGILAQLYACHKKDIREVLGIKEDKPQPENRGRAPVYPFETRVKAVNLVQEGKTQKETASVLGVSESLVGKWVRAEINKKEGA